MRKTDKGIFLMVLFLLSCLILSSSSVMSQDKPTKELREKMADGYLSLVGLSKDPNEKKGLCLKAKDHMKWLDSKVLSDKYADLCTTIKHTCNKVLKDIMAQRKDADSLVNSSDWKGAAIIYQKMIKTNGCNDEVKKFIEYARKRHIICLDKLRNKTKK